MLRQITSSACLRATGDICRNPVTVCCYRRQPRRFTMARTPKARALGAALRQAREDKHLLLRELAMAINRDTGTLSRWETGERAPKPEHIAQILATLGVDSDRYDEIMTLAYGTHE